jgi:hypothetical protein
MAACCPDMVVRSQRFIVLRGHEVPEVEDTIVEREGFLIVSKRGAGAEFVARFSAAGTSPNLAAFPHARRRSRAPAFRSGACEHGLREGAAGATTAKPKAGTSGLEDACCLGSVSLHLEWEWREDDRLGIGADRRGGRLSVLPALGGDSARDHWPHAAGVLPVRNGNEATLAPLEKKERSREAGSRPSSLHHADDG